jgi:hypothetical protein
MMVRENAATGQQCERTTNDARNESARERCSDRARDNDNAKATMRETIMQEGDDARGQCERTMQKDSAKGRCERTLRENAARK